MEQENIQTKLFAFLNAEEMRMVETRGHYDADRRMWVGDHLSTAGSSSGGCYSAPTYEPASSTPCDDVDDAMVDTSPYACDG